MSTDLTAYQQMVNEALETRLARCKGVIPEHLLEVLKGYLLNGGKRLRPVLLMLCSDAFGGKAADVVPAAMAVEMYHNWSLIHDDIIDHDSLRRGRPSGHVIGAREGVEFFGLSESKAAEYGESVAILAGDLLQGMSVEAMCSMHSSYPTIIPAIVMKMFGRMGRELIGGEQLDVEFSHMPFEKVSETLVQLMIAGKTGALIRFSTATGTSLGLNSIDDDRVNAMGRFGNLFGISFQYQDDLLGVFGDTAKLGKPVGSDIREGKRTLLAVRTLNGLDENKRKRFLELYGQPDLTLADIDEVRRLMVESGAVESVKKSAEKTLNEALNVLHGVMPPSAEHRMLVELSLSMLKREV
ncbi:MAG: polyprenyl synthetase family protein [Victivallales bacterium]|nr:polyprenyl synthetase family protein [Victivallales bacterium]